jgi:hypothetical protein
MHSGFYGVAKPSADEYWQARAKQRVNGVWKPLIGKHPNEANGLLEGKPIPKPSTRKELAAFLNELAAKVGILYHPERNPNGYLATEDNLS